MNAIFKRVSIRQYHDTPVEETKIEKLLRAAMAAPSAGNQQPWEYYVVMDKDIKIKLSEVCPYFRSVLTAPVVFVACYRTTEIKFPDFCHQDMGASVENLMLEATELGLGTVWQGVAPMEERIEKTRATLNIPENLIPFALISCGYGAEEKLQEDRYDESRIHRV